jgi:ribulose bisphosphate carboxylase small subunit
MRHRFTFRSLTTREGVESEAAKDVMGELAKCTAAHPAELRVSLVDVVRDAVKFRCGACRRTYSFDVSAFETYQKEG